MPNPDDDRVRAAARVLLERLDRLGWQDLYIEANALRKALGGQAQPVKRRNEAGEALH